MRRAHAPRRSPRVAAMLLAAPPIGLGGCVVDAGEPPTPIAYDAGSSGASYPAGPFGVSVGSVIRDFAFEGYARPGEGVGAPSRVPIALSDFYNPTGEGTYPEGSPFGAGTPLPRGLVINVSAVWCVACQLEAAQILPEEYERVAPLGGELLLDLAESSELGVVASFAQLDNWIRAYDVTYPAVVDPAYQLGALFDSSAFPANLLIDTRTMTIVDSVSGAPADGFWAKLDALLAEP